MKRSRWASKDSPVSLWESQSTAFAEDPCELSSWPGSADQVPLIASTLKQAGLCPMTLFSSHPAYPVGQLHFPPALFSFPQCPLLLLLATYKWRMEYWTLEEWGYCTNEAIAPGLGGTSQTSSRSVKAWAEVGDSLPPLLTNWFHLLQEYVVF